MSGEQDSERRKGKQNGEPPQEQVQQERVQNQPPQGQPAQRPPRQQPQGGGNEVELNAAKVGALAFGVVGLGYWVLNLLTAYIGDESATLPAFAGQSSDELYSASMGSLEFLVTLAPLLAVGLAVYYYTNDTPESVPKMSAIASAAGITAVGFLMLLLMIAFEPDFADVGFGEELPGFLAVIIGTVVVAGAAGYVLDEDPLEVL